MSTDVIAFAQVMTVIIVSTGAFVGIGLGAWAFWRRGVRAQRSLKQPADDGRLDRLEAAVDAIAIEVERISEAQRYTVKLLSDRLPPHVGELPSPTAAKRVNTPH